uniref:phosphoenolpyruvate carboxykinase (ATP) n=1 Tax=Oryza punctata TaxID=4537 RepID=A0A0E0KUJ8_ORYPU
MPSQRQRNRQPPPPHRRLRRELVGGAGGAWATTKPPERTANHMLGLLRRAAVASDAASAPAASLRQFQNAYHRSNERLFPCRDQEVSYGLNWAIAGRGVVVKDKVFHNLETSELQKGGAAYTERLSGIPLHVRGNVISGIPDVSRAQFAKLLKLVTFHLSSISSLYVQDGAVGSSVECDAKVRVISDNPSAVLLLSNILWKTPDRSISHDTCPLTIYVASSISANVRNSLGFGSQYANGFAAADIERSSLILCGKAFADSAMLKGALSALTAPVLSARGGLRFPGWLQSFGGSAVLLFAPVDVIKSLKLQDVLVSTDSGVVVSSKGSNVLFATKAREPNLFTRPTQVIIVSSDSTYALPAVSKLSPGQAAYHFLAGYCDGKFIPAYSKDPSPLDPIALANSLFSYLKEDNTPTYLINAKSSGKYIDGKEFMRLIEVLLSNNLPDRKSEDIRVGELKGKYKSFLSNKFGKYLPKEFSF